MFAVFLLTTQRGMGHGPPVALLEIFMGQDRHVASEARLSRERELQQPGSRRVGNAVPWTGLNQPVGFRVRAVMRAKGRPGWKRSRPHC